MRYIMLASFAGALLLSACNREPENAATETDNAINMSSDADMGNIVSPPPAKIENASNAVAPVAPPKISVDQQMQDDADATGMTARLPNQENPALANAAASGE